MSATAVAGGRVLTTGYQTVLCLDAKSGAVQWKYDKGTYHGCMLLGDAAVVSGSALLGLADGKVLRPTGLSADGLECAAGPDGKFLVGSSGSWLVAAGLADGKPLWRFDAEKVGFAAPLTVAGEHVWLCGRDGSLRAFSLKDGKEAWSFRFGSPQSGAVAGGNALFVAGQDGWVHALAGN
jgi:outer membrane protein assembly factor BamB